MLEDVPFLEIGRIYVGKEHKRPVRYIENDEAGLYQFEYVFKEETDFPGKAYICGYGQNVSQVFKEEYKLVENLDLLYGKS